MGIRVQNFDLDEAASLDAAAERNTIRFRRDLRRCFRSPSKINRKGKKLWQ
jgi:hypothetical protein